MSLPVQQFPHFRHFQSVECSNGLSGSRSPSEQFLHFGLEMKVPSSVGSEQRLHEQSKNQLLFNWKKVYLIRYHGSTVGHFYENHVNTVEAKTAAV